MCDLLHERNGSNPELRTRAATALENHLKLVPEGARARTRLAGEYAALGRSEDAMREATLAMALRPNEATVLYNVARVFCLLGRKAEALDAISKAAGFRESDWARRDPDLALLHGDPAFERLYPEKAAAR